MKDKYQIKLVATDLDGTFLKNDRTISKGNLQNLQKLGDCNVLRVAATGRNLRKVKEVIADEVPFDYIVYSSGAGVFNWKEKKHIYNRNITEKSTYKIIDYLVQTKQNFHAFYPSPENHKHWYFRGDEYCEEFERYYIFNKSQGAVLNINEITEKGVCQFLVIIKENEERFEDLKTKIESLCPEIRVIRASSPLTEGFIWIEIFHHSVSKGNAVSHICDLLDIKQKETLGLGNDYNDFDLLDFTEHSYLTQNAPKPIRNKYPNIPSNENDGFAFIVQSIVQ